MVKRRFFGNSAIHLGSTFLMLTSLLSMLAWLIKTDQRFNNYQVIKVFQDKFLVQMTSKQKEATKQIKEYCAKYGKDSSEKDLDLSNFIVLEKYKLVYCSVPKVWKRILANLEGIKIKRGVHQETKDKLKLLSDYITENRAKILKTYKKFTFVRDPFELLISAYRDCFWGKFNRSHKGWKYYRKEIRKLLAKRRDLDIDVNADNTTFKQFTTYLVLRWREGGLFQEHWREQFKLC